MSRTKLAELTCAECGTTGKIKKIKYPEPVLLYDSQSYEVDGPLLAASAPTHICIGCGTETGEKVRSRFTMDIEALKALTGYTHWIPVLRGLYKDHLSENYPGWEWNDLIPRLVSKGILQLYPEKRENLTELMFGLFISSDIEAIEFIPRKNGVKIELVMKS